MGNWCWEYTPPGLPGSIFNGMTEEKEESHFNFPYPVPFHFIEELIGVSVWYRRPHLILQY